MSILYKRLRKIILEEYDNVLKEGPSKEKIPAFAVAKKMITHKYWKKYGKGWDKKIIKKYRGRGVSHYDLEKFLPDYIEGKQIADLFEVKLTEGKPKYIFNKNFRNQKSAQSHANKLGSAIVFKEKDGSWSVAKLVEGKLTEGWKKKKYKKNDYDKYNKLVKRGKTVLVQTSYGDEFAWEDGSSHGVFGSEADGREIELNHDDIDIVMHEGGKGSGRKPDDHTGGPSYANVPKGAKTSKQAKAMRKKSKIEKNMDKAVSDANAKLDAAEKAMKKKKVKKEGRTRLSGIRDLEIHSGGSMAQVFGKNAVVALDKKSMKELVKLIRMNMGLFEKLEIMMEGKSFRLSNGVKVEFLGKMKLQLTNYKGKKVVLDVGELRMFLKGAKKDMGVRA